MSEAEASQALFVLEGDVAHPSLWTAGPWDAGMQHGGAPASLIAHIVETYPSPAPMSLSRLTIDLSRPVPIAPITIETRLVREGRNIQTLAVRLLADGKECVRASALKIRTETVPLPPAIRLPDDILARASEPAESGSRLRSIAHKSFNDGVDFRYLGVDRATGRGGAWARQIRPMIAGRATSPLMAACATADYCNGMSMPLNFAEWSFINADLSIHFARPPVGEWMLLEAESWIGPDGRAIAFGRLGDDNGWFGRATQCLVIARR